MTPIIGLHVHLADGLKFYLEFGVFIISIGHITILPKILNSPISKLVGIPPNVVWNKDKCWFKNILQHLKFGI